MNFIEHLSKPKIAFYCLDITPFDSETFKEQILFSIQLLAIEQLLLLFLDFMNNHLIAIQKK